MSVSNLLHTVLFLFLLIGTEQKANAQWKVEMTGCEEKQTEAATYQNEALAMNAVSNMYSHLLSSGYLDARLDTAVIDSTINVTCTNGMRYTLGSILWEEDSLQKNFIDNTVYRKPKAFDLNLLGNQIDRTLEQYEDRGFPFATVYVKQLKTVDHKTDITLSLERGPQIVLDSLVIRSLDKIPQRYVRNYLDLRKGDYYNETKLRSLDKKLREIPFIQLEQPTALRF